MSASVRARWLQILPQLLGVAPRLFHDRRRFGARTLHLGGVLLQPRFGLFTIVLGVGQRLMDELFALLQQGENRAPCELAEDEHDEEENRERPDGVADVARERAEGGALGRVLLRLGRQRGEREKRGGDQSLSHRESKTKRISVIE